MILVKRLDKASVSRFASVVGHSLGPWAASACPRSQQASGTECTSAGLITPRNTNAGSRQSVEPSYIWQVSKSTRAAAHISIRRSRGCSWGSGSTAGWEAAPTSARLLASVREEYSSDTSSLDLAATRWVRLPTEQSRNGRAKVAAHAGSQGAVTENSDRIGINSIGVRRPRHARGAITGQHSTCSRKCDRCWVSTLIKCPQAECPLRRFLLRQRASQSRSAGCRLVHIR